MDILHWLFLLPVQTYICWPFRNPIHKSYHKVSFPKTVYTFTQEQWETDKPSQMQKIPPEYEQ